MHEVTFFNMLPSNNTYFNNSKTKINLAIQICFPFLIIIKLQLTY